MKIIILTLLLYDPFTTDPLTAEVYYTPLSETVELCEARGQAFIEYAKEAYPKQAGNYDCRIVNFEMPGISL